VTAPGEEPTEEPTEEHRYEALAAASAGELETLADRILVGAASAQVEVAVLHGPEVRLGTLRFPVPGTAPATAVIGHLALTTCTVRIGGHRGDGCRSGRELPAAVAAAICDAEVARNGPLAGEVLALCAAQRRKEAQARRDLAAALELTRIGAGS
jgi:alpha-D-ribose 1-methylphosphonate 5-triphosphate synthase subunit PhnG